MSEPSVSVIICAYSDDRKEQLMAALDSVLNQNTKPYEVIAVIDHNPALEQSVAAAHDRVSVVTNRAPQGLSGARNAGIVAATGDIVAFLDDDATAEKTWLTRMLVHYRDPSVIGVGGGIVPVWWGARPRWFPEEFNWVIGCSYKGQPQQVAPVRNPIGCNMSFRRSLYFHIGGFQEGMGPITTNAEGCDETEYFIRARQVFPKSTVLYDPELKVYHRVSSDRTRWRYFRKRCIAEGRSKARVVNRLGAHDGLSSERKYVTRVLPAGVLRGLGEAAFKFDPWGLLRAGTIVAGLGYTARGYLQAKLSVGSRSGSEQKVFRPIKIIDVDLTRPLSDVHLTNPKTGARYGGIFCLVRRAGRPVKVVEFPFFGDILPGSLLEANIASTREDPIARVARPWPEKEPFVTVIVATRDRTASLSRCLDSLLNQNYLRFDVIVVDNAPSSSATEEMIASRYSSRVRYVREERAGLARAHDSGVQQVTAASIAVFTDDDVIADPNWLASIVPNFDLEGEVGCVTGLILPAELETLAQFWTERHGGFGKGFVRRVFDLSANRPPGVLFPYTAGQFGSGANMAFSMEALRHIGGFDPAMGAGTPALGGDDLAAFFAVVKAGYQLVYEPEAIVWHQHRRIEEGMRRQAFGYGAGLGAYLTKLIVDEPMTALRLLMVLPWCLAHMLGPSSPKNQRLPIDYPAALIWQERLGILAGVRGYLRSRASLRRQTGRTAAEAPAAPAVSTVRD